MKDKRKSEPLDAAIIPLVPCSQLAGMWTMSAPVCLVRRGWRLASWLQLESITTDLACTQRLMVMILN